MCFRASCVNRELLTPKPAMIIDYCYNRLSIGNDSQATVVAVVLLCGRTRAGVGWRTLPARPRVCPPPPRRGITASC
jgi:hypothetical protein